MAYDAAPREPHAGLTDQRPPSLVEVFLADYAALDHPPALPYLTLRWNVANVPLGDFDLTIGSPLRYEPGHARQLSGRTSRHARAGSDELVTDPGHGKGAAFTRAPVAQGYVASEARRSMQSGDGPPLRGRVLYDQRQEPA